MNNWVFACAFMHMPQMRCPTRAPGSIYVINHWYDNNTYLEESGPNTPTIRMPVHIAYVRFLKPIAVRLKQVPTERINCPEMCRWILLGINERQRWIFAWMTFIHAFWGNTNESSLQGGKYCMPLWRMSQCTIFDTALHRTANVRSWWQQ